MPSPERVIEALRARRELWEPAPGLVGLRGDAAALRAALAREIATLTGRVTDEEWHLPQGVPLATLARADYFLSFPQWLTVAAHLGREEAALERVARAGDPAASARDAAVTSETALPPAACYHVYAALAGRRLGRAVRVAGECTCWRQEAPHFRALSRDWAFTMREAVCVGPARETEAFRQQGAGAAAALATHLGLATTVVQAEDPFFLPTGRGRALLQRVKALKHELVVTRPGGTRLAIASFNHHERYFGEAFDIRSASDGNPATSACVAFGVERWLLGFLIEHGPDARDWPEVSGVVERAFTRPPDGDTSGPAHPTLALATR